MFISGIQRKINLSELKNNDKTFNKLVYVMKYILDLFIIKENNIKRVPSIKVFRERGYGEKRHFYQNCIFK